MTPARNATVETPSGTVRVPVSTRASACLQQVLPADIGRQAACVQPRNGLQAQQVHLGGQLQRQRGLRRIDDPGVDQQWFSGHVRERSSIGACAARHSLSAQRTLKTNYMTMFGEVAMRLRPALLAR